MARRKRSDAHNTMRETAGAARAVHFRNGGTLAAWRGRAARFADQTKVASKRACRDRNSWE